MDERRTWRSRGGALHNLLIYGLYQAWTVFMGSFAYFTHLSRTSPVGPNPMSGQTYEMNNHGSLFYVRPAQNLFFETTSYLGILTFFVMVTVFVLIFGRSFGRNFYPVHFTVAAAFAAAFWWTAIRIA